MLNVGRSPVSAACCWRQAAVGVQHGDSNYHFSYF